MDELSHWLEGLAKIAGNIPTEEYAEQMGRDCALNGANTINCNFRLFGTPELTKAWERGKKCTSPTEK